MAQELYNEGRVVGFSAWEIFARDALDHGIPASDIPDEHEWLMSMMSRGASMVLRVTAREAGVYDFPLPSGSTLTAAGVILGSPFIGTCEFDNSDFAKKVTSYGPLIRNTDSGARHAPSANGSSVPYGSNYTEYTDAITEFIKIYDGIVFTQYAKWLPTYDGTPSPLPQPYKDIDPNYSNASATSVVRLYISETLNSDVYLLLTGFDNKVFLRAVSGWSRDNGSGLAVGGSTDTTVNNWKNGGMLGPEVIPWASKIVFTVPNSAYTLSTNITRTLPSDTTYGDPEGADIEIDNKVNIHNYLDYRANPTPFIDFESINLTDYYKKVKPFSNSILKESVSAVNFGFTSSYNSLIAWYPAMTAVKMQEAIDDDSSANFFPPALYAAKITRTGANRELVPIDVAAPGTVKCFNTKTEAINYRTLMPYNYAIYYNSSNHTYSFVDGDNEDNWFSSVKLDYLTAPVAKLTTSTKIAKFVALTDSTGTDYPLNGTSGTIGERYPSNLSWRDLLDALVENKTVDLVGEELHAIGDELSTFNTIGVATTISKVGATQLVINPQAENPDNRISISQTTSYGSSLATVEKGKSIKTGTNYIEFTRTKSGGQTENLRLYISTESPGSTNIPVGSIGIGW